MNIKSKIEQWILNKSNSYKFYKDQYEEKCIELNSIEQEFKEIKEEYLILRTNTWGYMNGSHYLIKTILVDYELNEPKNILKDIHELSTELLILISHICGKHGIEWWLDSSSLLGAVRHENFVPWDDEMDIGMLRKDYINFNEIIEDELVRMGLNDMCSISVHENSFLQLTINHETDCEALVLAVLNIFPYDFVEDTKEEIINDAEKDYVVPGFNGKHHNKKNSTFIIDTDKIFPLKPIKFGNNRFNSPNDVNEYLRLKYDDYLIIPKIISIHHHVDSLRYNANNEEIFGERLIKLQNINSNFNEGLNYEK